MKRLLLILSGILFLCSCSSDYELETKGKLEKLDGNTATIQSCISDFSESESPQIIDLANNKDIILNTDLQVGQEVFVYTKDNQTFLSQLNQEEIDKLGFKVSGNVSILLFSIVIGWLLIKISHFVITRCNFSIWKTIIISLIGFLLYWGLNYSIASVSPKQLKIQDYGELVFRTKHTTVLKTAQGNKTYKEYVVLTNISNQFNETSHYALLKSSWESLYQELIPCHNPQRLEKTLSQVNKQNQQIFTKLKKSLAFLSLLYFCIIITISVIFYKDEISEYFEERKRKKRLKKAILKEEISEDERHGKGSF